MKKSLKEQQQERQDERQIRFILQNIERLYWLVEQGTNFVSTVKNLIGEFIHTGDNVGQLPAAEIPSLGYTSNERTYWGRTSTDANIWAKIPFYYIVNSEAELITLGSYASVPSIAYRTDIATSFLLTSGGWEPIVTPGAAAGVNTPLPVAFDYIGQVGSAVRYAREDHVHAPHQYATRLFQGDNLGLIDNLGISFINYFDFAFTHDVPENQLHIRKDNSWHLVNDTITLGSLAPRPEVNTVLWVGSNQPTYAQGGDVWFVRRNI